MRRILTSTLALVLVGAAGIHGADFKSTWAAPDAGAVGFKGKKVVALVITKDEALRMSAEESLARLLNQRDVKGVAAYRVLPREEAQDKARAQAWLAKIGAEGVVVMRPIAAETVTTVKPAGWTSGYYTDFWGYYSYGWSVAYDPGYTRKDTIVTVETVVFSVARDKLLWGGLSETTNPTGMDAFMKDLVGKAVKEMKKQGLTATAK